MRSFYFHGTRGVQTTLLPNDCQASSLTRANLAPSKSVKVKSTLPTKQRAKLLQQEMEGNPQAVNSDKEPSHSHNHFHFIYTSMHVHPNNVIKISGLVHFIWWFIFSQLPINPRKFSPSENFPLYGNVPSLLFICG